MNNTEEIFSSNDNIHLPAQAASVTNKIAFAPNVGKPVRRLKYHSRDWPSESPIITSSPSCVTVGGYSIQKHPEKMEVNIYCFHSMNLIGIVTDGPTI